MPTSPPCVIVLFGATGDLARQKLIPALHAAHRRGTLPAATRIIAIGRKDLTHNGIREEYRAAMGKVKGWDAFARRITYHRLEFHDPKAYDDLARCIDALPASIRDNRLFYLATPQMAFPLIITHLSRTGLGQRNPRKGWHRVVFEKPFGSDLETARELNNIVSRLFEEGQTYRIDHYLGKSFVQEILALRFSNPIFEYLWNRDYIDNIQIVVSETTGIGTRGEYYDKSGAIRDMFQNHLLQLLALTAMEPPSSMDPQEIRHEKTRVLRVMNPAREMDGIATAVITGQYRSGRNADGLIPEYRKESGVRAGSDTETYVAMRVGVQNHRWHGVPFYLRTGKAMKHHYAQIAVTFKSGPCLLFNKKQCPDPNVLVIRIQPDEGVKITFNLADGQENEVRRHTLDFCHEARGFNTPQAYELLFTEVMQGNQTLFTNWDFLGESWRITDALRAKAGKPFPYTAGTHGPEAALALLHEDGRDWIGNAEIIRAASEKKTLKREKKR